MPETRTAVDVLSATPTKQLVIERTLKASPERVFDAFTDPDQLKTVVVAQRLHLPRRRGGPSRRWDLPARHGVAGLHPYRGPFLPLHGW